MSSLVDNIVLMNWVELGDSLRLAMTIAKMRGNPVNRLTHECDVIEGQGMQVRPRVQPAPKQPFSNYAGLVSRAPERNTTRGEEAITDEAD
jgi:circadian clock protein KaiC